MVVPYLDGRSTTGLIAAARSTGTAVPLVGPPLTDTVPPAGPAPGGAPARPGGEHERARAGLAGPTTAEGTR